MGDLIRPFPVRSGPGEKPRRLRLYFDSGSPYTFISRSAASGFLNLFDLSPPVTFLRHGGGRFAVHALVPVEVKLLGYWCRHAAYVVEDRWMGPIRDLRVGFDFMLNYDVRIDRRRHHLVLNRDALRQAQNVLRLKAS